MNEAPGGRYGPASEIGGPPIDTRPIPAARASGRVAAREAAHAA